MNAGRLFVLGAMLAASSGMACTAIILAQIGDSDEWPEPEGGANSSSSSSSSGATATEADRCSLLVDDFNRLRPSNACSDCIHRECGQHVAIACDGGDGKEQTWFSGLESCAQRPWDGYVDPDSGVSLSSSWGCGPYELDAGSFVGESLAAKESRAKTCVKDRCIFNEKRDCRQCDVWTRTGSSGEIAKLSVDPCGQCFATGCPDVLADCCSSETVMQHYMEACAYTENGDNKTRCLSISAAADDDAGGLNFEPKPGPYLTDRDKICAFRLGQCFRQHCTDNQDCK